MSKEFPSIDSIVHAAVLLGRSAYQPTRDTYKQGYWPNVNLHSGYGPGEDEAA
jgi:hypothetical protein